MSNPVAQIVGTPIRYELDGVTDDLLTAGLGADGLRGPAPTFVDPLRPTARELRMRAIYMNYRGLTDITPEGGFGTLFGPAGHSFVAGVEYLFAIRTPDGSATTSALLQIPRGFDPRNPCLVAVASSGSRGVYGALPTAGEWGLRNGCAVIHSDKGTGTGLFDVSRGRGVRIDGTLTDSPEADNTPATYSPPAAAVGRLKASRPESLLFKHAHSGLNVEAHWGEYLLQAIDAAFQLLNREYTGLGRPLVPDNTLVIASGISNGGATVLRALERDHAGWIDGAVVEEPAVNLSGATRGLAIESGGRIYNRIGLSLFDYATQHLLLQPCALLADAPMSVPVANAIGPVRGSLEQWCRDLADTGILTGKDINEQAQEARRALLEDGSLPEALGIGHLNVLASVWSAVVVSYASAYGKLAPDEFPCGVSFAAVGPDGSPRPLSDEELARVFSDSSGIPPTAGVALVAPGSSVRLRAVGQGTAALAACLRELQAAPGSQTKQPVLGASTTATAPTKNQVSLADRISVGQREVAMTGKLPTGVPVILLQGRADALIQVNHAARAYYAVALQHTAPGAPVRYYEIEHGQHFDAFLGLPDLAARYVPMQPYLLEAMDLMNAHLRHGTPLPPSQVVRSHPRGAGAGKIPPLARENLGAVRDRPGRDAMTFDGHVLRVP